MMRIALLNTFYGLSIDANEPGKYQGHGHGKALLDHAIAHAKEENKNGLLAVVGKTKFHFMSDTKWLLSQGFEEVDATTTGFVLLALNLKKHKEVPKFTAAARAGTCPHRKGLAAYYSDRSPYTDFYVASELTKVAKSRKLSLKLIKLKSVADAQAAPTPATIFSLFNNGKFVTTDMSVCLENRFDKIIGAV